MEQIGCKHLWKSIAGMPFGFSIFRMRLCPLSNLLEALSARGHRFPVRMLERCLHILKHRGPDALLRFADRLTESESSREEVREHLSYLRKRLALMRSPLFSARRLADRLRD